MIELKHFDVNEVKADGQMEFWASTKAVDRDGDIIVPGAFDKHIKRYMANPVFLAFHNPFAPCIGITEEIKKDANGYLIRTKFHRKTELSQTLYELYKDGYMRAVSVGFITKQADQNEHGGRNITEAELLEISAVNVPANPEALAKFKTILPDIKGVMEFGGLVNTDITEKAVVPYKKFPGLPQDRPWDAAKALKGIKKWAGFDTDNPDWKKIELAAGWMDRNNPERLSSYKLFHHEVVDGQLKTNFRGCIAVIQVLNGGRGGVDIPDDERKGVYNHVAKHLREEWDYEPPELRFVNVYSVYNLLTALNEKVDALLAKGQDQPQNPGISNDLKTEDYSGVRDELLRLRNLFKGGSYA